MCVQLNTVVIKLCFMRCGYLSLSKYELKSEVKLCGHLVCLNRYYKTNHKEKYIKWLKWTQTWKWYFCQLFFVDVATKMVCSTFRGAETEDGDIATTQLPGGSVWAKC